MDSVRLKLMDSVRLMTGFREANDWIPLSLTDLQLEPPGPRLPLEGPYYTPGTTLLRPRLLYTLV